MSQPEWKLLWATDDRALYIDQTGVYDPELAVAQTDDDTGITYVYRFDCPRVELARVTDDKNPTDVREYLVPYGFSTRTDLPHAISQYDEWFHEDLSSVAATCDHASIREDLCSEDPTVRASAYDSIGSHHGFNNLDGYPREWDEREFSKWPERGTKLPTHSTEHVEHNFTDDERDAMSLAFDAGNYAHAYESEDLDTWDAEHTEPMTPHERAAFILGFFGSLELDEISSDGHREIFDEAYWSAVGYHVVKVAKYTDDRADAYADERDEQSDD